MPPNEKCPSCGVEVPDWHREWHTTWDQVLIFRGTAGMECPLCGAMVMHDNWHLPLMMVPPGGGVVKVTRDVIQAASWCALGVGKLLADYLKTREGAPYAHLWSPAVVQQADQFVRNNP